MRLAQMRPATYQTIVFLDRILHHNHIARPHQRHKRHYAAEIEHEVDSHIVMQRATAPEVDSAVRAQYILDIDTRLAGAVAYSLVISGNIY